MQQINMGGPPPMPPGSHRRFRPRRQGFWATFAAQSPGLKLNIALSVLGMLAVAGYFIWWLWPASASEAELVPTPVVIVATLPPIEATTLPIEQPPAPVPTELPTSPPEPIQLTATAEYYRAITRPAGAAPSENYRIVVGTVTLAPDFGYCASSNIGISVSGQPYFLWLPPSIMISQNPQDQMAEIRGVIYRADNCQYDMIQVQSLVWLSEMATPAPVVAVGGQYTTTAQMATRPATPLPTPYGTDIQNGVYSATATAVISPTASPTAWTQSGWVPEPWPTQTNYQPAIDNINDRIDDIADTINNPTSTPRPTSTPSPTSSPTPSQANITGQIIAVAGCDQSNLAISTGGGASVLLLFNGASLPPNGSPTDYNAFASGRLTNVCSQPALLASSISYYLPTLTPTSTSTPSPEPTATELPTSTSTPSPEPTATELPTSTSTSTPAATDTATPEPSATASPVAP